MPLYFFFFSNSLCVVCNESPSYELAWEITTFSYQLSTRLHRHLQLKKKKQVNGPSYQGIFLDLGYYLFVNNYIRKANSMVSMQSLGISRNICDAAFRPMSALYCIRPAWLNSLRWEDSCTTAYCSQRSFNCTYSLLLCIIDLNLLD